MLLRRVNYRGFRALLIENLMSDAPGSPRSRSARNARTKIAGFFRAYFTEQRAQFPIDDVLSVVTRLVNESTTINEADPIDPLLLILIEWQNGANVNIDPLIAELGIAGGGGFNEVVAEWAKEMGIPFSGSADLPVAVTKWAKEHGGELIKGIDEATRNAINDAIANGLANQEGISGIMERLNEVLDQEIFSEARIEAIARTESAKAVSKGAYEGNISVGATHKESFSAGDGRVREDICIPNEQEGRIPIDQPHQSGDMYPPFHPNCRCTEIYFGADPNKVAELANAA